MIDMSDLVRPEAVAEGLSAASKKAVLQQVGALAASAYGLDARQVAEGLTRREKLGSTGYGAGTAIPHARLPGLDHVVGVVVRLAQPIDFDAVDGLPVDLVFALLSPVEAGADHLKALARVSRLLRKADLVAKLRGAGSRDALYALMIRDEARDAA